MQFPLDHILVPKLVSTDQVPVASATSSTDSAQSHAFNDSGMDGAPYDEPSTPVNSTLLRQINAPPQDKKPTITLPPLDPSIDDEEEEGDGKSIWHTCLHSSAYDFQPRSRLPSTRKAIRRIRHQPSGSARWISSRMTARMVSRKETFPSSKQCI